MAKLEERFFILTPTPTGRKGKGPISQTEFDIYLDASGLEMFWSAKFPIPAIGTRIWITLNGIGPADVVGYFCSPGDSEGKTHYVGVMTKALKPPAWLRRQQRENAKDVSKPKWYRDGMGAEFGTEISLTRPRKQRHAAHASNVR